MLPGSAEEAVISVIEEESGKRAGIDFGLCVNPEFLREGSAVDDYHNPAFTLIGAWDERSGEALATLYQEIDAPVFQTDIRTAEMVKYVSNAFHALKVSFANEIGLFCKTMDIDSHRVMAIFTQDTRLNISAKYLQPGFAFGGSCLPKDLRALVHRAKTLDIDLPVLNSILPSNEQHIEHAFRLIQSSGTKKVGILGLSFKAGTDDLRESPMVHLAERLLGKGYDLRVYDKNVSMARVMGANKQYIEHVIPHISTLLVSETDQILTHADVLVVGNNTPEYRNIVGKVKNGQQVIDFARVQADVARLNGNYQGICW
jgi:GDP-mannose 6-dehydrogenase